MQSMLSNTGHLETGRGLRLRNVHLSGYDKEKEWYPMCKSTEVSAYLWLKSHRLILSPFNNAT